MIAYAPVERLGRSMGYGCCWTVLGAPSQNVFQHGDLGAGLVLIGNRYQVLPA